MLKGKDLILATKEFTQENRAKSWWVVLSTGFLLGAALAGTLWNIHWAGRVACSILAGLLVVRMFVIYHDHQHKTILTNSVAADVIMKLYGIYVLAASSIWKSSHNYHHKHNSKLRGSHIGSYPIMTKDHYISLPRGERIKYLFMRHWLTIGFGYIFIFLIGMCIYPFINNPRVHWDALVAFLWHVTAGVLLTVFFGWQALVLTLILPQFIAGAIGAYLFYAQHNFPKVKFKDNAGWTYEGAALESSSFIKMSPIMHWFTANIGYHHIHHMNAHIPFYRLPEVMKKMPEMGTPKTTSLNPIEIVRCLRLKVWDVEAQRMIPLSQL